VKTLYSYGHAKPIRVQHVADFKLSTLPGIPTTPAGHDASTFCLTAEVKGYVDEDVKNTTISNRIN